MTRITLPGLAGLNPDQARVAATIAAGPRGGVRGPLAVWLHRPQLADRAQALGQYCRYDTCLPPRLSELAIVVTGYLWQSAYEWNAHVPLALEAGIAPGIVDTIRHGGTPDFEHDDERVVHDFVTALHLTRRIDDALYARAVELLGEDGVVDLVGVAGYYTLISMTINAFEIDAQAGNVCEFPLEETQR